MTEHDGAEFRRWSAAPRRQPVPPPGVVTYALSEPLPVPAGSVVSVADLLAGSEAQRATVDQLFRNPAMIARRVQSLTEQALLLDRLMPERRRATRLDRLRARVIAVREAVAVRLAPWLEKP